MHDAKPSPPPRLPLLIPPRLTFAAFLRLLALAADKKGMPLGDVAAAVATAPAPTAQGTTVPEAVRLHDDLTTYSGVYGRGGMSTVDDRLQASGHSAWGLGRGWGMRLHVHAGLGRNTNLRPHRPPRPNPAALPHG